MSKSVNFINYFLSHRNVTAELVNKIDEEHYEYKPTDSSIPTKKLVIHMLTSFYQFASAAAKKQPEKLHNEEANISLSEVTQIYTDATVDLIKFMSDEDFEDIIDLTKVIGAKLPAKQVLRVGLDHEINHKGNLFVYVREMGHTDLPMFVQKG